MEHADPAPVDDEPTPAPPDEAPASGQPDAGDVTGTASAGADQPDEQPDVPATHEESTDPNAVGDFTDPPEGAPELDVEPDEDGGDTDE